jgi:hypothetical protein
MTATPDTAPHDKPARERARWAATQFGDSTFDDISRWPLWSSRSVFANVHVDATCPAMGVELARWGSNEVITRNHDSLYEDEMCAICAPDGSPFRQMLDRAHTLLLAADLLGQNSWLVSPNTLWSLLDTAHTDPWSAQIVEQLRQRRALVPAFDHDLNVLCVIDTGITALDTYAAWAMAANPGQTTWLEQLTIHRAVRSCTATRDTLNQTLNMCAPGTRREQQLREELLTDISARGNELAQLPMTRYVRTRITGAWTAAAISHLRGTSVSTRVAADSNMIVGGHPVLIDAYFAEATTDTADVVRNDSRERAGAIVRLAAELEQTHHADTPLADLIHVASALTP